MIKSILLVAATTWLCFSVPREAEASADNPVQGETGPAVLARCLELNPEDEPSRILCVQERERRILGFLDIVHSTLPGLIDRCRSSYPDDVFDQFDCARVATNAIKDALKPYATSSP